MVNQFGAVQYLPLPFVPDEHVGDEIAVDPCGSFAHTYQHGLDNVIGVAVRDPSNLPPWDREELDDGIIAKPFIRTSHGIVVAAPFELMATLRHLIAVEAACAAALTAAASNFATRVVTHQFDHAL
ncbi:hypothetical protein [Nocardia sp. NPDC004604]|uniref:hypothetical protein n=1 Tax=Nocardia sp. NPDC004604 TaxID=3157013 RepID=UPI0033AA4172